jgi:hypothetical protein
MNAEQFLESKGMKLGSTAILTIIDSYMRQPDLCLLMEDYAKLKIQELDYKATEGLFPSEE